MTTSWWDEDAGNKGKKSKRECYHIIDSHIAPYPIFQLDTNVLTEDLLPQGPIHHRNSDTKYSAGANLSSLIERLITEIKQGKNNFTDFKVLQRKNFNSRKSCGLLVLKFNKHPFVLKLFMETPKTFANPHCKGIEPTCFFFMGSGVSRHMTGFTRIPNAKQVREKLSHFPEWRNVVEIPRKWFWLPKDNRLIRVVGKNVGTRGTLQVTLPSIYAVIADAIPVHKGRLASYGEHRRTVMKLCNDLELRIDAHRTNFIFIKPPGSRKHKIVVIDTEHFPTLVGIKKLRKFKNSTEWYMYLTEKCATDTLLRTKRMRREAQSDTPHPMALTI